MENIKALIESDKNPQEVLTSMNEGRPGYAVGEFGDLKDNDLIKAVMSAAKGSKALAKKLVEGLKKLM